MNLFRVLGGSCSHFSFSTRGPACRVRLLSSTSVIPTGDLGPTPCQTLFDATSPKKDPKKCSRERKILFAFAICGWDIDPRNTQYCGPCPHFPGPGAGSPSGMLTVMVQSMKGQPVLLPPFPEPQIRCQETWEQVPAVP